MFNLNTAIHVLTCRLTGRRPTRKSYKIHFLFQKECSQLCNFCGMADKVSQACHTCTTYNVCVFSVPNNPILTL